MLIHIYIVSSVNNHISYLRNAIIIIIIKRHHASTILIHIYIINKIL